MSTRSTRSASIVHAAALGLIVLVLALQLVSAPHDALPSIAEIAPNAVRQITEPPPEQATDLGKDPKDGLANGESDGGAKGADNAGDSNKRPKDPQPGEGLKEPRQFKCVGSPARQTEDPQSPRCIPFWKGGDNGGATAPGVGADEIRVVVPGGSSALIPAMENYFNERYNFYGRRMRLIDTSSEREGALDDPIGGQERAAIAARTVHDAFASTDFWYMGGLYYMSRLADPASDGHPVIGSSYQSLVDEDDLAKSHPYLWQYPMATDRQLGSLGSWTCRQLIPGKATRSSDARTQILDRSLGLVVMDDFRPPGYGDKGATDVSALTREISGCGGFAETYRIDLTSDNSSQFTTAATRMADRGVTTVVCVCDSDPLRSLWDAATGAGYFPEWVLPSHTENEHVWIKRSGDDVQAAAIMGLEFHPTFLPVYQDPWYWAASEGSPGFAWDALGNESSYSRQAFYQPLYRSLLVIASGVQLAGPNLTADSFARGLQAVGAFPNPEVGLRAGQVSFIGDHTMTEDASAYWFSTSEVGPFGPGGFQGQGAGTACFLDGGKRFRGGAWAKTPPAFSDGCFTGETLTYDGS